MRRHIWCAFVGCPELAPRQGGFTPEGQELPDWMSWSEYVITVNGVATTAGSIVQLPIPYYGPSIPLGSGWTYGGSVSPTPTSTTASSSATTSSSASSASASPTSSQPLSTASSSSSTQTSSSSSASSASRTSSSISSRSSTRSSTASGSVSSSSLSSGVAILPTSHHHAKLGTILPAVLVPSLVLIAIAALLIWYLLKKRKEREDERIAAYREARWAPVPTTDPQEKQPPGGGPDYSYATPGYLPTDPDGPQDNGGMLSPVAEEDEARSGDEHTSLLESEHRSDHHHRESGYITEGMAPTGGAIAGLALLRSLGIGRRGSSSSHSSGEGSLAGSFRNVSGNTMEKMVGLGLVSTTSIAKQSRLSTQSGSQSHSGSGAKTTSSGSAAYLPYTDDELFYKAPFARESAHAVDSGDVYFSAESGPPTGSSGDKSSKPEEKHVPGEHGSIGSNSGSNSSSGHSRRSGRSAGSKSSSGRGPRVPTIPEHRVPSSVGFTALAGLGGAAAAGVAYGTVTSSEYDQGTESGNSQYDSAGSGSASGESNAPPRRSVDITEFGSRQPRRRERPRDRTGGFSGRSWFEKNISVGTFGEPEAERRMSSEHAARTSMLYGAAASTYGTASSGHGLSSPPSADFPLPPPPGIMGRSRSKSEATKSSGSQTSTPLSHKRSESLDPPVPELPTPAALASPLRRGPYAHLVGPLPSLNRTPPAPLAPGLSTNVLAGGVGGDMMLSPFGFERQRSTVAAVALGVTPSLAPADRRHSGASRSVGDLLVMGPNRSGAATSLGDREKSGDKVYSEFGQPRRQASRSAPDVLSLPVATISTQGSRDTSAMSMASHVSVLPWSEFAYLTVSPPESVSAPSIPNSTPSPTHSPTLPSATPATVHTGTLVTPHLPQGVQRMPAQGAVANLDSSDEDGDMSLVSPGRRRFQWTR